jgi:membrane protein YqaA with SNARE-associated domain
MLGAKNSYLVLGILGFLAGFSSVIAAPFYASLITFSSGGLNIFFLALVGGISITISHSVYYYLGYSGRHIFSLDFREKINNFFNKINKYKATIPIIAFLYFSFTPFPNEIILTSLGIFHYSFKKIFPLLLLGNIVLMFIISALSYFGVGILSQFF